MKQILLASTAVIAFAGMAAAQTQTSGSANRAEALQSDGDQGGGRAEARRQQGNNDQYAIGKNFGDDHANAQAKVGGEVTSADFDTKTGQASTGGGTTTSGPYDGDGNVNVQETIGSDNDALSVQSGDGNGAVTRLDGTGNNAFVSQKAGTHFGNGAVVANQGDYNDTAIITDGLANMAVSSTVGNSNTSFVIQKGDESLAVHAQEGNSNTAMTVSDSSFNGASHLQIGDNNESFISQGYGDEESATGLKDEDGDRRSETLESPFTDSNTPGNGDEMNNAAASLQLGDKNQVSIIQAGGTTGGNQAVSFQKKNSNDSRIYQSGSNHTSAVIQDGYDNKTVSIQTNS